MLIEQSDEVNELDRDSICAIILIIRMLLQGLLVCLVSERVKEGLPLCGFKLGLDLAEDLHSLHLVLLAVHQANFLVAGRDKTAVRHLADIHHHPFLLILAEVEASRWVQHGAVCLLHILIRYHAILIYV